ncbi:MAG: TIGR02206 family membrane protein [Saprospiraceae bacterium]|nr:TIGR02206 family membrane protein [Saprospiraceae bacterium]
MNESFEAYSSEHALPLVVLAVTGFLWFRWASRQGIRVQRCSSFYLSLILPLLIVIDMMRGWIDGSFQVDTDLPLHMCRLAAFVVPIMLLQKSRPIFGVLYFWILAGTLQAIITPDLSEGFPTYPYVRYWLLHAGLVVMICFPLVVYRFRPTWRDLWNAVWTAQIYLLLSLPINSWLGSNYGYTMYKPPVASIADLMGPWPWYILAGEVIMIVLFLLLLLPFLGRIRQLESA